VVGKYAICLDGGFVKKKLAAQLKRFPTPKDVVDLVEQIKKNPRLTGGELLRVFYYDAPPYAGQERNPVDGSIVDFSNTPQAALNRSLIETLELEPDFAVRRGVIVHTGWKLGNKAMKSLIKGGPRQLTATDFVPDMGQKGVDLRIGLDIARLSLKRLIDALVLVTGDSDFVPAMKFARIEGVRVYLEALGHGVRLELKAHADVVF
jgi:uncharacterized LabA/DUF88 family protein